MRTLFKKIFTKLRSSISRARRLFQCNK